MEIRFSGANGVELIGDEAGDARTPAVLLLHGGGQTRHSWSGTALRLADAGFRAISLDLRGHGDSGWAGPRGYRIDDFAADLRAVVEQLEETPARFDAAARTLTVPTLLVRGGISDVVSPEGVRPLLAVLPGAETVDVADAGHMVVGDQNDPFSSALVEFLTRSLRGGPGSRDRALEA